MAKEATGSPGSPSGRGKGAGSGSGPSGPKEPSTNADRTIIQGPSGFEAHLQIRQACFVVISGSARGKRFKLTGSAIIGRSDDCGICLDDEGVSRQHARVEPDGRGSFILFDLNSTNGTYFLDGRRILRETLKDGDEIQFGSASVLKLCYPDRLEEDFFQHQYDSATRDGLTGVYNKRYFLEQLHKDFAHARRHREPLSLIAFDIDHFKRINDTWGHPAGDRVLKELAQVVSQTLRSEDWFARVGGEEFAIIERALDEHGGRAMAERIRRAVEDHRFDWEGERIPVTISLGVATLRDGDHDSVEALIRKADVCLYIAKEAGRNRVASAPD